MREDKEQAILHCLMQQTIWRDRPLVLLSGLAENLHHFLLKIMVLFAPIIAEGTMLNLGATRKAVSILVLPLLFWASVLVRRSRHRLSTI